MVDHAKQFGFVAVALPIFVTGVAIIALILPNAFAAGPPAKSGAKTEATASNKGEAKPASADNPSEKSLGIVSEKQKEPSPEHAKFFENKVRPLLSARCFKCHGPDKQNAELRLDSLGGIMKGGESGPALVRGKPDDSNIIDAINFASWEMPPKNKLPAEEIQILTDWVKMGAPWPGAKLPNSDISKDAAAASKEKITDEDRAWWSYQPVKRPTPPTLTAATKDPRREPVATWNKNPIDRFIWAKLQSEQLQPSPQADPATLIRRAYFDLVGLPPSTEEVTAFVAESADASNAAEAYEKLIDRLLASPRYGERWGRHWLDLVRYAESDGYRQDAFREHAWHYRDYVIRSFNDDKPYDRFIMEQLAGDEIDPENADAKIATGFLRHGIYEYNQRDVRRQVADIANEVTDVTADVFLGMGMGCARCHDHKFDPILQKDYYRLQAFFTPMVWRDYPLLPTAEQLADYKAKTAAWEQNTVAIREEMAAIEAQAGPERPGGGLDKFPAEIQQILLKPAGGRTPLEEQLAQLGGLQIKVTRPGLKGDLKKRYEELTKQLNDPTTKKPSPLPIALGAADVGTESPPTTIYGARKPEPLEAGFPEVMGGETAVAVPPAGIASTGRRTALARWIATRDNPLTARVMVNRIWQYHFGRGLVATSSDFGHLGEKPSHPELLDWLASEFIERGWSIKQLHRLMVTSSAYRQASLGTAEPSSPTFNPATQAALLKDPENRLLWRANCRRLDAEQVRDAALAVTGELEAVMFGPSVPTTRPRRSIYTKTLRNTRDSLLEVFDGPDGYLSTAQRNSTTTPTQALLMVNGDWMLARAEELADRLSAIDLPGDAGSADADLVEAAFRMVYGRKPTTGQQAAAVRFLSTQRERAGRQKIESKAAAKPGRVAQRMPHREGSTAIFEPGTANSVLGVADNSTLPAGDFTIEAYVMLQSLFPDATVRTIAAQWGNREDLIGWSLGVTSEKSKYKPRNIVLQIRSGERDRTTDSLVLPANLHLELNKPYYVAASVRVSDPDDRNVTFYLKDLSDNDAPLLISKKPHKISLPYRGKAPFTIGGLQGDARGWDGLIDDVRLTASALPRERLLYEENDVGDKCVGFWRFEETPGFFEDSAKPGNHLSHHGGTASTAAKQSGGKKIDGASKTVLTDFCHALLNSNEFLYVD